MFFFYRLFINIILIISPLIILVRLIKKKESLQRFTEKFGVIKKKRYKGILIWFHVASVGEFQSIVPILEKYEKLKKIKQILVTSNTLSSSYIASNIKLKKVTHQFFPIDNTLIVKKFISYWKPSLALFVDSEIWPNMILNLSNEKIPIILLNARLTKRSYKRWVKFKNFSKLIFNKFSICLSSNKQTNKFLKILGVKKIKYFGNLKYSQSENEKIAIDNDLRKFVSNKTVLCAASTHEPEEKFISHVHLKLKKKYKDLFTIIIPRHINREKKITNEIKKLGLKVHVHKPKKKINLDTDIYIVNSYGKTKSFLSLTNSVFLGGSLINHGGQNPLEAARFGCKILHGPHTFNFHEIYKFLEKQKISKKIYNENQAIKSLTELFDSKKSKKNIKNKIKYLGKKILNKNINQINIILSKL